MSMLSILELVRDYNKDKPSIEDQDRYHEPTAKDRQKLERIVSLIEMMNFSFNARVMIYEQSRRIYIECKDKPPCSLPSIRKDAKKV